MRGKRPNGKTLLWRRCRRAAPEEVPNGFSVYRRFALGATAPVPDQIAVAEPGGAGGGAAVGAHPDPAPGRPVHGMRHLHGPLLPPPGTAAVHRRGRFPAAAAGLGAPGPAPVCPGTRSGAAADGLDLAPRPLPLPVGDAAGWRPGGAVGLLPGPGRTGRLYRPVRPGPDRKSTRLNSSHSQISY